MRDYAVLLSRLILLCLAVCFFTACDQTREILTGLNSRQSIETLIALRKSNVAAERNKISSGREERYSIDVPARDYVRALEVVQEYGLPSPEKEDIDVLTRPQSFAPLSQELSELRLDYALGLRVEQLMQALPGVVDAHVFVRAHLGSAARGAKGSAEKPTASVVLRYKSQAGNQPFGIDEVKQIVARAVPGLAAEDVLVNTSLVVIPGEQDLLRFSSDGSNGQTQGSQLKRVLGFRVPDEDKSKAVVQILLYFVLFCAAGGILGYVWGVTRARRHYSASLRRVNKDLRRSGVGELVVEAPRAGESARGDTGKFSARREGSLPAKR